MAAAIFVIFLNALVLAGAVVGTTTVVAPTKPAPHEQATPSSAQYPPADTPVEPP
jgi:hypothetical protein